jgi:Xaa-Pro aminopeptidase
MIILVWKLFPFSFSRLAENGAKLWLDSSSINAAIVNVFRSSCERYVKKRGKAGRQIGKESSQGDPATGSSGVQNGTVNALYKVSPATLAKAVKNEAEVEGMKSSHLRYRF